MTLRDGNHQQRKSLIDGSFLLIRLHVSQATVSSIFLFPADTISVRHQLVLPVHCCLNILWDYALEL